MPELEYFYPLATAVGYYAAVFTIAELTRKLINRVASKGSGLYVFAIELIGTAQMCTCVYENGIVVRYYGALAFFFVVASLLTAGGILNRGAFISPLAPIEMAYNGIMPVSRLLILLLAETIGGMCAFRFASSLWYYTLGYSQVHLDAYVQQECSLNYKVAFPFVVAFEIIGCFVLRLVIANLPERIKNYSIPVIVSGMLSFALIYVGVPGLNPVVASSRMFGCHGLDAQWFIALYWICPVIGWLAGAHFQQKFLQKKVAKKTKAKTK